MKQTIGIVYDTPFREVKRVVVPDRPRQLIYHCGPGEGMLRMKHQGPVTLENLPKIIAEATRVLSR